ncbi:MAG: IS607 family transposase [Candidatus Paceibacterales bacterium]
MNKFLSIQEAASFFGVSSQTLRRWEKKGKIAAPQRTIGGQRRYDVFKLQPSLQPCIKAKERPTVAYARVSSHDQKNDLQRQENMLEMYCSSRGWTFEIIKDLGSGMNYHKRGLRKLLNLIMNQEIGRLVLTHKDRLLRFGAELVFSLCEVKGVEVVVMNQGDEPTFEEELAKDALEIITVFSARLYGSRSHKNKKLMNNLKNALDGASE